MGMTSGSLPFSFGSPPLLFHAEWLDRIGEIPAVPHGFRTLALGPYNINILETGVIVGLVWPTRDVAADTDAESNTGRNVLQADEHRLMTTAVLLDTSAVAARRVCHSSSTPQSDMFHLHCCRRHLPLRASTKSDDTRPTACIITLV